MNKYNLDREDCIDCGTTLDTAYPVCPVCDSEELPVPLVKGYKTNTIPQCIESLYKHQIYMEALLRVMKDKGISEETYNEQLTIRKILMKQLNSFGWD